MDVIDAEYNQLITHIQASQDFQHVHQLHRNYLSTLSKHTYVDNNSTSECIDKILTICIRFIALCRLKFKQEEDVYTYKQRRNPAKPSPRYGIHTDSLRKDKGGDHTSQIAPPLIVPIEELKAIMTDYRVQVECMYKAMSSDPDSGRLLLGLDYNGYYSKGSSSSSWDI